MDSLRLSDADRESAVDLLSEHYSLGRLTKDEFDERSDAVWSAKTQGDLAPVFADLPTHPSAKLARTGGGPPTRRRRFPVALAPVLFVLVAITVITHLPFVLIAVGLWFFLGRRHWHACWSAGPRRPPARG
jgi:hypothetical protein